MSLLDECAMSEWKPFWERLTTDFAIDVSTAPVPVPAAIWLMGSGLMGLFGFSRKKSKTA